MKAYERAMAVAMVAVMVMSAMVCILPATEDSDAAISNKTVNLSDGQTKISTISVNDTAFDFKNDGDGIMIEYKVDGDYDELYKWTPTGNWAVGSDATSENGKIKASLSDTGYDLSIEPKSGVPDGEYTFYFTGTEVTTDQSLTIKITITSRGAEQYLEYPFIINVYKSFTNSAKIAYGEGTGKVGDTFSTGPDSPKVYYSYTDELINDPVDKDLSNFVFYATGFNKGVGLTDGLMINGSVPEDITGTEWEMSSETYTPKMNLTFVVTDTRTGYMVTIDEVNVSYKLNSGPVVDFTITYTSPTEGANVNVGNYEWAETDAGTTATIVSNGSLTIIGATDNKATLVKTEENGSTTVETISLSQDVHSISLPGTGTIEIIVSVDGIDEKKITFIVIDDMIAVNDIDVTCGPVSST